MHIWLLSIFEQTPVDQVFSTRFLSIAEEALQRGHSVTFIGSTFKHNTKNQRFEETTEMDYRPGYRLLFVKSPAYRRNISPRRLWAHHRFSKDLIQHLNERDDRPDIILLAFPPVSVAYEVSRWAMAKQIPVVMDIIDPWPDTFSLAVPGRLRSLASPLLLEPMRGRLRATLKNLSGLTAISRQYIDWARGYYPSIPATEVLYPAADLEAIRQAIQESALPKEHSGLKVIYAGSLASSYDIPCILNAAALLEEACPDIHFFIAGAGPQAELVSEYEKNHQNLIFLGRLPKQELMGYYAQSDLGLTQHIRGASQSVTYKLFDLLSAGLPILNSLESEMKEIILNNEVGLHNDPGDAAGLAENITFFYDHPAELRRYRENGWELTRKLGDTKVVYARFLDLLEQTASAKEQPKR